MPSELESLLNRLPTRLYPFYERILNQVPNGRMQGIVFRALRWIMFAARSFWVEDLVEACAIFPPSGELFEVETRQHLQCLDLIEYLGGLVRIQPFLSEDEGMILEPRTHMITLAHFSVSEFLQRLDTVSYQIDSQFFERSSASMYMSRACLIYLAETLDNSRSSSDHSTMVDYANRAWNLHMATYLQSSKDTPYAQQATNAALASKIRNSVEFSNLTIYDDCDTLREYLRIIAQGCLDQQRYVNLLNALSRITKDQEHLYPSYDGEEPCAERARKFGVRLYPPLDPGCIRLLILHPAEDRGDHVRCSLIVDYLENRARYEYLSYIWGRSGYDGLIQVNRLPFRTMSNLSNALPGLRSSTKPVLLWVDAICIDQNNLEERNHQVSQMGDLVRCASNIRVWLSGECPEEYRYDTYPGRVLEKFLENFHAHEYWRRLWLLQGFVLAQDIHFQWGQTKLTWSDLMRIIDKLDQHPISQETASAIDYFSKIQELRKSRAIKRARIQIRRASVNVS
jgi:hypothetical protein